MSWIMILAAGLAGALGFANGANDNAKGVATLIGGKVMTLGPAVLFAAVTTAAGSVAAIWIGVALIEKFKGKGIVGDAVLASPAFPLCVAFAAAATVLLATQIGMPISTTHAMVGSIIGIGFASDALSWLAVWDMFFYPLLASPPLAVGSAAALYLLLRAARRGLGIHEQTCVCVGDTYQPIARSADGTMVMASTGLAVTAAQHEQCAQRYVGRCFGVDAQRLLDGVHVLSAGALSFARGLNDTPKIAAVVLAASIAIGATGISSTGPLLLIGVAIAAGGLLAVRRVAQTVSYRITGMNDGQALSANLNAAALVIFASRLGLPVSTTHVTCGSLFGIGLVNQEARWPMIAKILAAWVTTLPVAATLGALAWLTLAPLW
jgi:PiT family inorganic phosphate transporter